MNSYAMLSPGPVPVPEYVWQAISQPVIHHRSDAFYSLMEKVCNGLRFLFQTKHHVGLMMGSGTYGVESAMYSLFRPGEQILVVDQGKFSERWVDYGRLIGLDIVVLHKAWGETVRKEEILEVIRQHPELTGVVLTHCETSTGVMMDLEEISFAIREERAELLILVDGISTIGAIPFYLDDWQLDAAVLASQKSLCNPAGLALFAMSQKAFERLRETHSADFRNLYNYLKAAQNNSYPYTAPVSLMRGILAVLDKWQEQSLAHIWNEVHQSSQYFKHAIAEIGGEVFSEEPSGSMTAFTFPDQDMTALGNALKEAGFELAGGQGHLKGKILRTAHFAGADREVMERLIQVLTESAKY